jgi:uncharacterized iron-regulated membrane protein
MTWVYKLHFQFFAGPSGGTLVGIAGLVMLLSVVSGVVLWWPLLKGGVRAAFAVRGGGKLTYDLHKTVGILSAALLLVIAFTGIYMEFPHAFQVGAGALAETTQPPNCKSSAQPDAERITADEAVALAAQRFPNARFDHLHPPEGREGVYEIAFRQPGEVQQSYGRTLVYLDQYTGEVLAFYTPRDFTAADVFFAWQFPLHNGEAFGLVGRWVVFFVGLAPTLLYVTGCLLWWRKRQARHRQQLRKASAASTAITAAAPPPRQLAQELAAPVASGTRK